MVLFVRWERNALYPICPSDVPRVRDALLFVAPPPADARFPGEQQPSFQAALAEIQRIVSLHWRVFFVVVTHKGWGGGVRV